MKRKTPRRPAPAPHRAYYHAPPSASSPIKIISAESLTHVASFLLDYGRVNADLPKTHKSLSLSCKILHGAAHGVMDGFCRDITAWTRAPRIIMTEFLGDALRLRIDGVTKGCAEKLLVPKDVLQSMPHSTKHLARSRVAYSYNIRHILGALRNIYPSADNWEAAYVAKAQMAEAKRHKRVENKAIRDTRRADIDAIVRDAGLQLTTTLDARLERLYVSNGARKHLKTLIDLAQSCKSRQNELVAALGHRGLYLRNDSKFCQQFINGTTRASIDEVVATMGLSSYLFSEGGPRMWSMSHDICEDAMRHSIRTGRFQNWWEASLDARKHARYDYSSDDEWDSDS